MKSSPRRSPSTYLMAMLMVGGMMMVAAPARSAGVKIGDDQTYLKIALLLQSWAQFTHEGAPDGESLDSDFYLRRMRILFFGQLNDKVNFFVETDNPNFGKGGSMASTTFIQDAYVELNLHSAFQLAVGMVLPSFSHHGMQGAVSLHSLDYHTAPIRYPTGSHKVWRNYGAMARGLLMDDALEYRLVVTNGVRGSDTDLRNPHDWPRFTGRLTVNLMDAEGGPGIGGMFYDGTYIKHTDKGVVSTKKIFSIGASIDWQKDLNVGLAQGSGAIDGRGDYMAFAGDVFFDLPLTEDKRMSLGGQINFYYYDYGDRRAHADGSASSFYASDGKFTSEYSGYGMASELGLRYDACELLLLFDFYEATKADGDAGDVVSFQVGFNWWIYGHSTSLKLQVGETKKNGGDWGLVGILQLQLLF